VVVRHAVNQRAVQVEEQGPDSSAHGVVSLDA
jgi:hypothetical protein